MGVSTSSLTSERILKQAKVASSALGRRWGAAGGNPPLSPPSGAATGCRALGAHRPGPVRTGPSRPWGTGRAKGWCVRARAARGRGCPGSVTEGWCDAAQRNTPWRDWGEGGRQGTGLLERAYRWGRGTSKGGGHQHGGPNLHRSPGC